MQDHEKPDIIFEREPATTVPVGAIAGRNTRTDAGKRNTAHSEHTQIVQDDDGPQDGADCRDQNFALADLGVSRQHTVVSVLDLRTFQPPPIAVDVELHPAEDDYRHEDPDQGDGERY